MGQLVLEIPQNVNRTYRIESEQKAADILEQLENGRKDKFEEAVEAGAIELPKRKKLQKDGENILGIWAEREESGQEIAHKIREENRKIT